MKAALTSCALSSILAFTACETRSTDSLEHAAKRQSNPVRIEFVRAARFYENGDALFTIVNESRQLLWFLGRSPELPAYHIKAANFANEQNTPVATKDSPVPERYPLAPGETRYISVSVAKAPQPMTIGVNFYTSRTGTNAFMIWSGPVTFPVKGR